MIIVCPSCKTYYELNDQIVQESSFLARCNKCQNIFSAYRPVRIEESTSLDLATAKKQKDNTDTAAVETPPGTSQKPSPPHTIAPVLSYTPPTVDKNSSVTIELKPVIDNPGLLDANNHTGRRGKGDPLKPGCDVVGISQAHDGTFQDESDIVIGFDLGTSSSKVVIRDSGRQTAYAVPFGALACSENLYLIPTRIFIGDDGHLSLSPARHSYSDLKIRVMDSPAQNVFSVLNASQTIAASELAAAYIALVIHFARGWFLKHTESIYRKTHIHWHINLGTPSKNYNDQKIRSIFQIIAMAAWRISRLDSTITIAEVKKILLEAGNHIETKGKNIDSNDFESLWLHPDFVNTHPEVIMEIVGYARSPLRTNGLHLLVDVGATTMDAATFIIHSQDGEDVFPLLETTVERYGTMELHNCRIQALKKSLQESLQEKNSIDSTIPLPDPVHYEIKAGMDDFSYSDGSFFKQCSAKIGEVIRATKKRRDPNSRAWADGLPVFICGGGGRLPAYREMVKSLGSRIAKSQTSFNEFEIKEIPKPDQLEAPDLPHQEYDRLAVAYGLSFTAFEIGEVIQESKISDIHREKTTAIKSFEDRFVSKDMC